MWSNKYINIPFVDKGREPHGVDCWGLVRIIYQNELCITLPSLLDYKDTKDKEGVSHTIEKESSNYWIDVTGEVEQPFDVVVFRIMGCAMHVGLVVKRGWMVHCERGCNSVHSEFRKDPRWKDRIEAVYRYAAHTDRSSTV